MITQWNLKNCNRRTSRFLGFSPVVDKTLPMQDSAIKYFRISLPSFRKGNDNDRRTVLFGLLPHSRTHLWSRLHKIPKNGRDQVHDGLDLSRTEREKWDRVYN